MEAAEQAVTAAQSLKLPALEGRALATLGVNVVEQGNSDLGLVHLRRSLQLVMPVSVRAARAAGIKLAWVLVMTGAYQEALGYLTPFLQAEVSDPSPPSWKVALHLNVGWATLGAGDTHAALVSFVSGLSIARTIEDTVQSTEGLVGMGCAAAMSRTTNLAARFFAAADDLVLRSGIPLHPYLARHIAHFRKLATRARGEAAESVTGPEQVDIGEVIAEGVALAETMAAQPVLPR